MEKNYLIFKMPDWLNRHLLINLRQSFHHLHLGHNCRGWGY